MYNIMFDCNHSPLSARGCDSVKSMPKVVLVTVIANRTQVIVGAFCTLPPDPIDWLLMTSVTHGPIMFYPC